MRVYIKWGTQANRAEGIAEALKCRCIKIDRPKPNSKGRMLSIPKCAWQTFRILRDLRPKLIISQHTHPFITLVAHLYKTLYGNCHIILDCHNGPLTDSPWTKFPLSNLNQFFFRRYPTILHNEAIRERAIQGVGKRGEFILLHDRIPEYDSAKLSQIKNERPTFLVPASWSSDEPIHAILEASRIRPNYTFKITGTPLTNIDPPSNCILTGYLSEPEYLAELQSSQSAIALSTRDDVLTRASQEALGVGIPPIVTNTETARSYFSNGAIYTANTPHEIASSCDKLLSQRQDLVENCQARVEALNELFSKQIQILEQRIQSFEVN